MIAAALPENMPTGNYEIACAIGGGEYSIVKIAIEAENDGEFYSLAKIEIKE